VALVGYGRMGDFFCALRATNPVAPVSWRCMHWAERVVGDGMSVYVTHAGPFAESCCHKFGREARFNRIIQYHARRMVSDSASFDGVPTAG
jgi:hypothetical protein